MNGSGGPRPLTVVSLNRRTSLRVFRASLLTGLGLSPLSACSSSDSAERGAGVGADSGSGGSNSGSGGSGGGASQVDAAAGGVQADAADESAGGHGSIDASRVAVCENPQPRIGPDGQPTGFVDCANGFSHRESKATCGTTLPRSTTCGSGVPIDDAGIALGECAADGDCTAQTNGYCELSVGGLVGASCFCNYGCRTDADCATGMICACGAPVGQCVPTQNCLTDADCGPGLLCVTSSDGACGFTFACQTAADTCSSDADCAGDAGMPQCGFVVDHHECVALRPCGTGRPFLVGGEIRVAATSGDPRWRSGLMPGTGDLSDGERRALSRHWTSVALLEHASIAAFARFALELLALGAPPEFLADTHAAMADETIHARDAFALASAYAGRPVGPGALDVESALCRPTLLGVLRTVVLEGCIGETVAAIEAAEALDRATDPAVRTALARVAPDEGRHALLAWRFVRWVLETGTEEERASAGTELLALVNSAIAAEARRSIVRDAPSQTAHGLLPGRERNELRRRVLTEVVQPCARLLVRATPERPLGTESFDGFA